VDITTITDLTELKALAYDQIVQIDTAQQNLNVINGRIRELSSGEIGDVKE